MAPRADRDFDSAIKDAARSLAGFSNVIRTLTGGGPGVLASAQGGGLGGLALGATGALVGGGIALAQGAAEFFTPAARAYSLTGSSAAFSSAVTQSTLGAIGSNTFGAFALAATGVEAQNQINLSAAERVSGITAQLARYGVQVSDEERSRLIGVAQEQEGRAAKEAAKVYAEAGSVEALKAAKPEGAGAGYDAIVSVLERIETLMKAFGSGGHQ